jgi:hypothetical protein
VLAGLEPGSTGDRETDVTSHPFKASSPGWAAIATAHPAGADLRQASGRRQTQTKARLPHMPMCGRRAQRRKPNTRSAYCRLRSRSQLQYTVLGKSI